MSTLLGSAAGLVVLMTTGAAHAQSESSVLVETAIPDNFDRGRNVSVAEHSRPEYDALGIRTHSFLVFPTLDLGLGATDNVYLTHGNTVSDAYLSAAPAVMARSDWQRDQVVFSGAGYLRRFIDQPRRNESAYDLRLLGAKDIGETYVVTGEAQFAKLYETPDSGAIDPSRAVLSSYQRSFLTGRVQYRSGQARAIAAVDRTAFTFNRIDLGNIQFDQSDRDRVTTRGTVELQYAFTPSLSAYGQAAYGETDYSRLLADGTTNRDSTGWRVIGGANFDLAGLMRGKLGVGYINRNYRSPVFRDASGFSAEALIEFFPSELTTYSVKLSRTIEDASVNALGAFFVSNVEGAVEHELLNNLILRGYVGFQRQTYIGAVTSNDYYRVGGTTRYLVSHFLTLNGSVGYLRRAGSAAVGSSFDELTAQVGISLRR